MDQRAEELVLEAAEPKPGEFTWRRIPGTAVLAMTNLFAAGLLFDSHYFLRSSVHIIARVIMPFWLWGTLFLVSGLLLFISVFVRKLYLLNIGGAISLFVWTAISTAGIMTWFFGRTELSPIAGALFFWMMGGQAAMLIVPLVGRGRGKL